MKQKSVYSVEGPTRRVVPLGVAVVLSLLLILSLFAVAFTFGRSLMYEDELDIVRSELAEVKSELSETKSELAQAKIDLVQAESEAKQHSQRADEILAKYGVERSGSVDDLLSTHNIKLYPPTSQISIELPENGEILYTSAISGKTVAPLTISTKGDGYYYVKLKNTLTGKDSLAFFVYGGSEITVDVPLGGYDLVYAYGHDWLGVSKKFGKETVYSKADEPFLFYQDNGYINGWTVELYMQPNGNLGLEEISASEF